MEAPDTGLHAKLAAIQENFFLPDYGFPSAGQEEEEQDKQEQPEPWPSVSMGTTVSGFVGGLLTLLLAGLLGLLLKARSAKSASA